MPPRDETVTEARDPARVPSAVQAPHLFLIIECTRPLAGGARSSLAQIDEVVIGRGPARSAERELAGQVRRLVLTVPDRRMSERHARLRRDGATFAVEDLGSKNGTRVNGAPVERVTALQDADVVELGQTLFRFRAALPTPFGTTADLDATALAARAPGTATLVPALSAQLDALAKVARSKVPVLLLGETGTGKEVLARAVHALSGRAGAFVAVNCGALTESLLEAQLFGHVRGAFSGATRDEAGFVRSADGGTLFLDEIGDLPRPSQAALLRVLQEHEVVPVGAARPIAVDIRVVAATHDSLDARAASGEFRADLLARLAGLTHVVPPLRDRREDLGLLLAAILPRIAPDADARLALAPDAARALLRHTWPTNVRELYQCLAVSTVLADGGTIELAHLPASIAPAAKSAAPAGNRDVELERALLGALAEHRGNVSEVARAMGKARMQIQRWIKRFGIDPKTFRDE